MPARLPLVLLGLVVAPSLSACGPLMSSYLIISAEAELDGAKAAEAEQYAVYEYTAASAYLSKAREEQGYADFGPSIDYAYKAQDLAVKAKERAERERDKLRAPEGLGIETFDSSAPSSTSEAAPRIIIQKAPQGPAGHSVEVQVVPVAPEQPE